MKIIGHGGAAGLAPRNTLAAIGKAIELGVDEVEFDVRVTADAIPVLYHHQAITINDSKTDIRTLEYAELKQHIPGLPTLQAALNFIDAKAIAHLEVKPGENIEPIVAAVKSYLVNGHHKPFDLVLASRSGKTLRQLHRALPSIPCAVIEFWSSIRAVHRARILGTKRIDLLEYWLWSGLIRNLTRHGYQVCSFNSVYPARARLMSFLRRSGQSNNPKRLKAWQKAGLYGVITDYPDLFEK